MIAHAVQEYDDENIHPECEEGWRRFCADVLARTYVLVRTLCDRHRRHGMAVVEDLDRMELEELRRQVAAYRWVTEEDTGGALSFADTCEDVGRDPYLTRKTLLSACRPERDINLVVSWVMKHRERRHGNGSGSHSGFGGVGSGLVAAVRDFRSNHDQRQGKQGTRRTSVRCQKD